MNNSSRHSFHRALVHIPLGILFFATIMPFVWMFSTSLKPDREIYTDELNFVPVSPTLSHYLKLFEKMDFLRYFSNSMIVAGGLTLLSLLINALAAYAFAKMTFKNRELIFTLLVLTMMVPGQVTMMPVFLILKYLGLLNSYWGLIVPGSASVFAIYLLRQFIREIPDELIEAARIDGCSEFGIFFKIVLPLCRPVIATMIIFNFMGAWNEFFWPLIVMLKESKYTLPVALANMNGQYQTDWGVLMAGSVLVVIPVIFVFLLVQKHYIKGITAGAVKG